MSYKEQIKIKTDNFFRYLIHGNDENNKLEIYFKNKGINFGGLIKFICFVGYIIFFITYIIFKIDLLLAIMNLFAVYGILTERTRYKRIKKK